VLGGRDDGSSESEPSDETIGSEEE
jgi:hypothetical protein